MRSQSLIIIALLLLMPHTVFSQDNRGVETDEFENLDDLFSDPEEDIIIEEPEIDNRSQFESSEMIKFSGVFKAQAIVAAGWTNWTFLNDVKNGFDPSVGFEADFKVSLDVRPARQLRIFSSLFTAYDPFALLDETEAGTGAEWIAPTFKALYLDYILKDTLFTRFGKFSMGWGQGRFYKQGNLMKSSSDSALNFRFSLPVLYGLSFIVLTNNSTNYREFSYAGKIDFVFGETMISPGVKFTLDNGLDTLLSFKQVLFKTDFLIDFTTNVNNSLLQSAYVVAGFYRDWSSVEFYGEYQFSWLLVGGFGHEASLALRWKKPFGAPFNLGIQFEHYFLDWSGTVTLGLTQKIFPFVNMKIGLPIVYGADGSNAVINNSDPSGRRIALALALELSASF